MPKEGANRKTKWQLVLVEKEGILVSIYSQLPNKLVYEALRAQKLPEFAAYPYVKSEYKVGGADSISLWLKKKWNLLLQIALLR